MCFCITCQQDIVQWFESISLSFFPKLNSPWRCYCSYWRSGSFYLKLPFNFGLCLFKAGYFNCTWIILDFIFSYFFPGFWRIYLRFGKKALYYIPFKICIEMMKKAILLLHCHKWVYLCIWMSSVCKYYPVANLKPFGSTGQLFLTRWLSTDQIVTCNNEAFLLYFYKALRLTCKTIVAWILCSFSNFEPSLVYAK